jgi:hypothetical protein
MQATGAFNLLDPSSWPGTVFLQVIAGLLLVGVTAVLGWLIGRPVKWWFRGRALHKLIRKRKEFVLVYNPYTGASKAIVLLDGGRISAGMNNNEHTWRVRRGTLEFLAADGKLWSRFKLDEAGSRLAATTDSDVRSLFGQYLLPQHIDWSATSCSGGSPWPDS